MEGQLVNINNESFLTGFKMKSVEHTKKYSYKQTRINQKKSSSSPSAK